VSRYRKIHLFDVAITGGTHILESNTTIPGDNLEDPISTPIGKRSFLFAHFQGAFHELTRDDTSPFTVGLLTCFDLRFPELSLSLRRKGAQLLCYPSAFTVKTGESTSVLHHFGLN